MEKIDADLITSDQTTDKRVLNVYSLLKQFRESQARTDWLKRHKEAWDVIENKIWTAKEEEEMKDAGMVPLVINDCVLGVQGGCAVVTDQKPKVHFKPVGSGDKYVAELLNRAFDQVWIKNEGSDEGYDMVEDVKVGALGFIGARLDRNKDPFGKPVFELEPSEDIYFDYDSKKRDFSDTPLIKAKLRSREYIKEHYPDLKNKDIYFDPVGGKEEDRTSSGVTGRDNYAEGDGTDTDSVSAEVVNRQKNIWEIDAWLLRTVKEDWIFELGDGGAPIPRKMTDEEARDPKAAADDVKKFHWPRQVEKRIQLIIVGKKLISEIENPYGADQDGEPIVSLIGLKGQRTRSAYPMSETDYASPICKERNKRRAQTIHAVSQTIGGALYEYEGTKWEGTAKPGTPGSRAKLSKNVAGPPGRVASGAIDIGHLVNLDQQAKLDIDDQYKTHDVMKGKIPPGQSQMAGRTVLALQDFGGMMQKPFLRRYESALIRLAKVVMVIVLQAWPRYKWEALIEPDEMGTWTPDGKLEAQGDSEQDRQAQDQNAMKWIQALDTIRKEDVPAPANLSILDIDVQMVAGSSMPTNRMAKQSVAMEMYEKGLYDRKAALSYADDPEAEEISERMDKKEEELAQAGMLKK